MKKVLIPVMIAAALALAVVGVGAGFAQQDNGAADTFLSKVAAKLGIGEDKLKTAVDEAYSETIDEQVAAGQLTQDQADRLKERGFELAPMFAPRGGRLGGAHLMESAATVLGISADDLMTQLRDGKSLADVAEAQGISVDKLKTDLLAQVKTELDTLVSDGKITQSQADDVYSRTESNIDTIINATGPFGGRCPPGGPGPGPMSGSSDSATPGSAVQPETGL
jgi:polyhydroxyalkanoate synthesis regulator phasin